MAIRRRRDRGKLAGTAPWIVDFRVAGRRIRVELDGRLAREEARAEEDRLRAEARAAVPVRFGLSVSAAVERYWREHGQALASARTERSALMAWATALGHDTALHRVDRDTVAAILAGWRASLAIGPGGLNRRLGILQRLHGRAREVWGASLPDIPWRRLKLREADPAPRAPATEALARFLDALPPRSRWPSLLAAFTGLRRGAVLRLTTADIDWQRGTIRALSKGRAGGRWTPVPMSQAVLAVLQAMGPLPQVGALFPVTIQELRNDRERARIEAGLPDLRFHDLRHWFAQSLEDAGLGDVITDALHHSTPALRRRYAAARIEHTRAAVDTALGAIAAKPRAWP